MKIRLLIAALSTAACAQAAVRMVAALPPPNPRAIEIYRNRAETATPSQVMAMLIDGNNRFAQGRSTHGGYPIDARERIAVSATGQRPIAAVLSCIDSRTTPELVFDAAVGDIFTARVGANVINDDVLGSLEIAVKSGAKVLIVLGHTDCGGVKAACTGLQLGHMTQLLDRIKPVVNAVNARMDHDPVYAREIGEKAVTNRRYVAEVSHMNEMQSARQILERSPFLREKIQSGQLILASGLYDVDSGKVVFDAR